MSLSSHVRSKIAAAFVLLLIGICLFFWFTKTPQHQDSASNKANSGATTDFHKAAGDATAKPDAQPQDTTTASPALPGDSAPQEPMAVANDDAEKPRISTRAQAANGGSVVEILQGADMSDPEIRALKVAELRLLDERQNLAVEDKARQLGVPLRIDGPGHKVSKLYDFRGDEPLYRSTLNKNAAISTAANLLAPAPYALDGTGIKVGVWDGDPIRGTHQELTGRITLKDTAASVAAGDHATHVAGTIGATGVNSNAKGMAPKINIDSYEWTSDYAEMTAAGAATAGDAAKIPLSNHSYGAGNPVTADMGRYETEARAVDAVATTLPYYLIFWAAGNEQLDLTAKGGYQSITFDGLAKNIMTIGAAGDAVSGGVRSFAAPPAAAFPAIADFSSLGPCDDGRIKPDIVANGVNLFSSVAPVASGAPPVVSNTSYDTYSGTSMATPNAMGSTALLVQLYAREFSGQRMRASMLKALLIETADDIGNPGPDYTYGWGLLNVKKAADLILAHKVSLAAPKMIGGTITSANKTFTHTFTWDGVSPIRATLCWTDPAGAAQTAADSRTPNLKNNLDAKITAPNGTTIYQPYVMPFVGTWTTASMALPATVGKNNVDNVEQVYLAAPTQAGTYTVTVSLDGTLTNSSQAYSLVISGGSSMESNPPPNITLTSPLSGSSYLPGAPVTLSATATDLTVGGAPGAVTQVEFFNGTTSLGVDATAPYSVSWTPSSGGTYSITAKATDNESAIATSTAASITVLTGDGTPVLSSFTPGSGAGGSLVIISGSNFVNVSAVKFNGLDAVFTVDSAGQITATVPPLATSGTIFVANNYGTGTSVGSFTIVQAPVLISQIYGAGGNSGAAYKQDYIELYNRGAAAVSLAGWSVQYASSSGTTWAVTSLTGSIAPGKYYLVGLASGSSGSATPTPDASGTTAISATTGKVALVNSTTALSGISPAGTTGLQDFVGFGTANAFEGAVAPAPSTTTAIFRAGGGATDTGNNASDFSVTTPNPRNSSSGPAITPVVTSATIATGTVGSTFSYQVTASNNPTSYAATGLPDGLVVSTSTGAITGTPTTAGSTTATISAINSAGTGSASLAFTISAAGGGGVTTNLLSENFGTLTTGSNSTTSGPSSTLWAGNSNFPTVVDGYSAGGMIKLGTGSSAGSITSKTLDLSPNSGNFFVSFKVKGWSSVEGSIKVTVTGLPSQTVSYTTLMGSSSLETKILTFSGGTANSTIKFETTANRAFLDDILVYYTSTPTTPVITAAGSLAAVGTTYGTASPSPASFTVSGANMTAGILVTPPGGFEVSLSTGSGYVPTVTIPGTGTIASTPVFLRLAATTAAGSYSGNITCTSAGASPVTVSTLSSDVRIKLLTITANNRIKPAGTAITLGALQTAFTSSGLVGSETIGTVTLTASGGTAAGDPAGTYSITPSAATGGTFDPNNYDFNYVDGVLTVTGSTYADWLTAYPVGGFTGINDDPDHDGIANGIENILGTAPNASSAGLTQVSTTPTTLVFRHTRSNSIASDLTARYEWSSDLVNWHLSAETETGTTVIIAAATITDNIAPANDLIEVTATLTGTAKPQVFVRLKALKP